MYIVYVFTLKWFYEKVACKVIHLKYFGLFDVHMMFSVDYKPI